MYLGNPPWDTNVSPPELMDIIETVKPGRALDIGCGTATNVITLAKYGWKATGIDFVRRPIVLGKKKARVHGVNVNLRVADITTVVLDEKFDLILDMGCFHNLHRPGRERYMTSIKDWLATNGIFLLYGFLLPEGSNAVRGIFQSDIQQLTAILTLKKQNTGVDKQRKSGWFVFQNSNDHKN